MKSGYNAPSHRFMLTLQAVFKTESGGGSMKTVNTVISRSAKNLPLRYIKQAQDGVAMQLQMFGVTPENIMDVTLLNVSYLGLMTEKDFTAGLSNDQAASVDIAQEGETPTEQNPYDQKH